MSVRVDADGSGDASSVGSRSSTTVRRRPRAAPACLALLVSGLLAAGCSDTDFSSVAPDAGEVDVGALPRPPADDLPRPDTDASIEPVDPAGEPDTPDTFAPASTPPVATPPVPTTSGTGAPDVDDVNDVDDADDALCAAWSQVMGTRQVLTMAADFGRLTDVQLARLELIAAALVTDALERLDVALDGRDAAVRAERSVVRAELFGRFETRARAALAALDELSPSDDLPALLAQVWLDALRRLDPDATVPELADLGPEFGPVVDRAAAAFVADAPRWDDDAALAAGDVDERSLSATTELIATVCPDLGVPGVGDAI